MEFKEMIIEIEDFIGNKKLVIEIFYKIFLPDQDIHEDVLESYYEFIVNFISNQIFHLRLKHKLGNNETHEAYKMIKDRYNDMKDDSVKFIYSTLLHMEEDDNDATRIR